VESSQALDSPAGAQIEDFNRAVAECSDEEPLTPRVKVHVVDAAFNPVKRDRLN